MQWALLLAGHSLQISKTVTQDLGPRMACLQTLPPAMHAADAVPAHLHVLRRLAPIRLECHVCPVFIHVVPDIAPELAPDMAILCWQLRVLILLKAPIVDTKSELCNAPSLM